MPRLNFKFSFQKESFKMSEIVNNDKLNLILTDYGLRRIQEVTGTTMSLNITKIKLGSGENHDYYTPSPYQEDLKGKLGLEFYIYDKQLLEDGLTVSFHTIIPEDVGGFDIREVGLYETHDGADRLFAISTQQPFVKPLAKDNYFININYYIFLKSQNLAEVYDQITLDVEHAEVTEPEMEELMRTFLFAQGNLISQINDNSTIIGYNRATQLYEKIQEDKKTYSYITLYKNFASLVDIVNSIDNIFSYWVYDYSRRSTGSINSIIDISKNGYYLSTNVPVNSLERIYGGFFSMFTFNAPNYFKLSSQIPLNLLDHDTNTDLPFTMIFVVEPLEIESERTLIAKSDYAQNLHSFEIKELEDRSVQVRLFSSSEDYLTFKTVQGSIPNKPHVIILTYKPSTREIVFFINSTKYVVSAIETGNYTHISETSGILYAFDCSPVYYIYAPQDDVYHAPISPLFEKDENNNFIIYEGTDWTLEETDEGNKILYKGHEAEQIEGTFETDYLYSWIPQGITTFDVIYTKELPTSEDGFDHQPILYTADYREYIGTDFGVFYNEPTNTYSIKYERDGVNYDTVHDPDLPDSRDIPPIRIYTYKYQMPKDTIFTNNKDNPSVLYFKNERDEYETYVGDEWTISNNEIYKLGQLATYNSEEDVDTLSPDLTSYVINKNGLPEDYINSNVGLISIVKEALTEENARIMALNLCATLGNNPYLGGF